jgi:uncharacterized membrane protein YeaQ/YmgE (transglycosylase-associated protein family)
MNLIMTAVGWREMTTGGMVMIAFTGGGVLLIFAYMMDVLMERFSFGIIMNALLLLVGAVLGLVILQYAGWPPTRREFVHALFLCCITAVAVLVAAASFKRAI